MKNRNVFFPLIALAIIFIIIAVYIIIQFSNTSADSSKYIFDISRDKITTIQVQSGSSGEVIDISEEQELDDLVHNLNSLTYVSTEQDAPNERTGWSYRMDIPGYGTCFFSESEILVRGVWYYFPKPSVFLADLVAPLN